MAKLTYIQCSTVCAIAREAFQIWTGRPEFEQHYIGANTFDAWRHAEQAKVVGRRSLSLCDQCHYERLKEHFQTLREKFAAARDRAAGEAAVGQQTLF